MARLVGFLIFLTVATQLARLSAQTAAWSGATCGDGGDYGLVVNGGFEKARWYTYEVRLFRDTFAADHWYESTAATVDIMRDREVCDTFHVLSMDPASRECVTCHSGEHCLGLGLLNPLGWVEHISGQLKEPLVEGANYDIEFWLKKTPTECSVTPGGFGVVVHSDSISVSGPSLWGDRVNRPSPDYLNLFAETPVYADYETPGFPTDTTWQRHSFTYRAEGGERFLTFGRFAYGGNGGDPTHEEVVRYLEKVNRKPFQERVMRLTLRNKLGLFDVDEDWPCVDDDSAFYLLDDVSVRRAGVVRP